MTRPLRANIENGWYHVYGRGIDRREIYLDDQDRLHFLALLEGMVERYRVVNHAYCLMTNHYHLILQTPEANLSAAMQWLSTSYSMWFNKRNRRVGPLFQGRFGSIPIENGAWAYDASFYVHLNPVMRADFGLDPWRKKAESAGFIKPSPEQVKERLSELRKYKWSSCRAYAGYAKAPEWLTTDEILGRAASEEKERRTEYRKVLKQRLTKGMPEPYIEQMKEAVALGSAGFVDSVKGLLRDGDRNIAGKRVLRSRAGYDDVVRAVEQVRGESSEVFMARRGDWGKPLVLWAARRYAGMTLREIGDRIGRDYAAVSMMIKRFEAKAATDRNISSAITHVKRIIET